MTIRRARDSIPCFWVSPELGGMEMLRSSAVDPAHTAHMHETFTIGVVDAGVVVNRSRGTTSRIPVNSVFTFNPGDVHSGHAPDDSVLSHRTFYPGEVAFGELARDAGLVGRPWFRQSAFHAPRTASRLRALHALLECGRSRLQRDTGVIEIFGQFLREHAPVRVGERTPGSEPVAVRTVREYIDAHCRQNVSLDELACLVDLNRAYLIRVFRQTIGIPPHAYLIQRRLALARQRLRAGEPLAEVALEVGFVDQSHLNLHFRRACGVTAGVYVRSHFLSGRG